MTRRTPVLALLVALLVACGAGSGGEPGPPNIDFGRDICIECGMIIDDPRFAAAYRFEGADKRFDDIGGMLIHGHETGEIGSATAWVHDFETERWINAHGAYFVHGEGIASPMGHGVAAFAEQGRAEAFARHHGATLVDWQGLLALPVDGGQLRHAHEESNHQDAGNEQHDH